MRQIRNVIMISMLLAIGTGAAAQDASNDEALKQFCALNTTSAVCEAGQAGKQNREGLDLAAEIAKGEAWRGAPETRGDHMSCLASWDAIRAALAAGDKRWPPAVTVAVAGAQAKRWEALAERKYKGLESRMPDDRSAADTKAKADISNARVSDVAQWAGFCKREPISG